jgi:hypothetical protein
VHPWGFSSPSARTWDCRNYLMCSRPNETMSLISWQSRDLAFIPGYTSIPAPHASDVAAPEYQGLCRKCANVTRGNPQSSRNPTFSVCSVQPAGDGRFWWLKPFGNYLWAAERGPSALPFRGAAGFPLLTGLDRTHSPDPGGPWRHQGATHRCQREPDVRTDL